MMPPSDFHEDSRTLAGLTEHYRDQMGPPTSTELDRGRDTFLARVNASKTRRRGWGRWSLVGITAALSTLLALAVTSVLGKPSPTQPPPALSYRIEGGSVLEDGSLRESGQAGMNVLFNEGSRFMLTPGTRGRIRVVDRQGARVAIEQGTASFRVAHNAQRRWTVEAGPFRVTVTGTVFTVSWDSLREQFDLRILQGQVVVSSPASAGEIALRAGQRLAVSLAKMKTVITEESSEPGSAEPAGATPTVAPAFPDVKPPSPTARSNGSSLGVRANVAP